MPLALAVTVFAPPVVASSPTQCNDRATASSCQPAHPAQAGAGGGLAASSPPVSERFSVRVQLGVGGGNVGTAARAALELDYWVGPRLALGLTAVQKWQGEVLGADYSSQLLAPVIALRTGPGSLYLYVAAASGYARLRYEPSNFLRTVDRPPEVHHGLGAAAQLGVVGRGGELEIGGAVAVDVLSERGSDEPSSSLPYALTLNLILGIPFF